MSELELEVSIKEIEGCFTVKDGIEKYSLYAKDKEVLEDTVKLITLKSEGKKDVLSEQIKVSDYSSIEDYYEQLFDAIMDKLV